VNFVLLESSLRLRTNFRAVYQVLETILAPRRQERKVTGQAPSSRTNVRDLRKISPLGRNDNLPLAAFAPLREILRFRSSPAL
jgi:hypothetical protein